MGISGQGQSSRSSSGQGPLQLSRFQKKLFPAATQTANVQLRAIRAQEGLQRTQDPIARDVLGQLGTQFQEDFAGREGRAQTDAELLSASNRLLSGEEERLGRFGEATPDELALIEAQRANAFEAGFAGIERSTTRGLGLLREQLGPSLGLRSTDTPVLDRGAVIAGEGVFQQGQLASQLASQAAAAALQLPLQRDIAGSGAAATQQGLLQSRQALSAELGSRAFQNRLAFAGQAGGQGLALGQVQSLPGILQGARTDIVGFSKSKASGGGGGITLSPVGSAGGD